MNIIILLLCSLAIHALKIIENTDRDAHDINPYMQFLANNLCGCYTEPTEHESPNATDISKCVKWGMFALPSKASFFQKYSPLPPINTLFENSLENWQQQQQQLWNTAMQLRNAQLQAFHGTRQQRKKHEQTEIEFTCTIDDSIKEMYGEWYVDGSNTYAREREYRSFLKPLNKCLNFILAESSGVSMVEMHHYYSLKNSDTLTVELKSSPWLPCMTQAYRTWQKVIDQRGVSGFSVTQVQESGESIYKDYALDNNRRCAMWLDMVSNRKVAKCCSEDDYEGCAEGFGV